tara:strand:- start:1852 stop:2178 length:327 start_codon:yes stop_codon:yes gene_type:complete
MEITGKVVKILELESGISKEGKEWRKQEIILNTGNEYNPEVCITAFGKEKIQSMNKLEVGMTASVLCNVYSREWQGKYYNSIDGYQFSNQTNNPELNTDFVTSDNDPF